MSAKFWDKRSAQYEKNFNREEATYQKTIFRTRSLILGKNANLLDFGCGTGEYSLELSSSANLICAIDTSKEMIRMAELKRQALQIDNIEFMSCDALDSGLDKFQFTGILAFNILHLVEDPEKVLTRLNELMAQGGYLISMTPCLGERSWLYRNFIQLLQRIGIAPAILSLKADNLELMLTRNKFTILESKIWDKKNYIQWIVARK
jgi:2-polyprenyl-3-methyl-5-hydroxy-6-metoxy-1,4-benzoquinol methylase